MSVTWQPRLFCPCGAQPAIPAARQLLQRARAFALSVRGRTRRDSLTRWQAVSDLRLDPVMCPLHHRRRGCQDRGWLATVCPGCRARVRQLSAIRVFAPPRLVELWAEPHPGIPLQPDFPFEVVTGV